MSVIINESGMSFGPFQETDVFYIEKSKVYSSLEEGIKTVEFILYRSDMEIIFIEAKSSSPRPNNQENFDDFIEEISSKFIHSMDIYFSVLLKRLADDDGELPMIFKTADYSNVKLKLILVIKGHKTEWLPPINNSLKLKLKRQIKIWRVEPVVMNHESAAAHGLLENELN